MSKTLFYPSVKILKKERMGPEEITASLDYMLPFAQVSGVSFDGEGKADVSQAVSCGEIFLEKQPAAFTDAHQKFSLAIRESFAPFRQGSLYMPQMVFGVIFYELFEQKALAETTMLFLGACLGTSDSSGQETQTFGFRMVRGVRLTLPFEAMPGIALNGGSAELGTDNGQRKLKMNFNGWMFFAPNDADYDYFSYDYLSFSNMKVDFTLSGSSADMECHYRDIRLSEKDSRIRDKSFLAKILHGDVTFISFQDAGTPDILGFRQIAAGCVQQSVRGEKWFGLVFPIELFHGIKVNILFAFGVKAFYAAAALGRQTSVTLSSLIELKWKEVQIEKTDGRYALGFRGLKVSFFGKEFPEGSVGMLLIPGENGDSPAWYALYDNRKGDGTEEGRKENTCLLQDI